MTALSKPIRPKTFRSKPRFWKCSISSISVSSLMAASLSTLTMTAVRAFVVSVHSPSTVSPTPRNEVSPLANYTCVSLKMAIPSGLNLSELKPSPFSATSWLTALPLTALSQQVALSMCAPDQPRMPITYLSPKLVRIQPWTLPHALAAVPV